ncbi:MAG: AmpE protein [Halieaceae bacterium]|jgi:AmpE protein
MTFLALIIAVVMLQVWGEIRGDRYDSWFLGWQTKVWGSGLSQPLGFTLLILVPALLVVVVQGVLESTLFGLLWIGAAAGVLYYSFGRKNFSTLVERYSNYVQQGDFEAGWLYLQAELSFSPNPSGSAETDKEEDGVSSPEQVHKSLIGSLVYEGYQRWFAVVFYFVLLGPAAALTYRLLQISLSGSSPATARRWIAVADWLPARLLALTFALAGDFVRSRKVLAEMFPGSGCTAGDILSDVSRSAVGVAPNAADAGDFGLAAAAEARELGALLVRSGACWFVVFSLLELFL